MMYYSLMLLLAAVVAGLVGFTGIAGAATWPARTLCFAFLAMFIILQMIYSRDRV